MEPLVSVIIPVYNVEKYIGKCLESLVMQSYQNLEIIAVNDGSTDRSNDILKEFQEKYPEVIRIIIQKNAGQSVARNRAMEVCQGKYVAFVDGDDYVEREYIGKMVATAEKHQAEVVACGYNKVDPKGNILSQNYMTKHAETSRGRTGIGVVWGQLFLKSLLDRYHFRFAPGKIYEDSTYSIKARMLADKVYFISYLGYNYIIHSESTMKKSTIDSKRFPFKEFEEDIIEIQKYISQEKEQEFEYEILQFIAGFLFLFCRKARLKELRTLCEFFEEILRKYFPYYWRNQHVRIRSDLCVSFLQKCAVIILIFIIRIKLLFPITAMITRV